MVRLARCSWAALVTDQSLTKRWVRPRAAYRRSRVQHSGFRGGGRPLRRGGVYAAQSLALLRTHGMDVVVWASPACDANVLSGSKGRRQCVLRETR